MRAVVIGLGEFGMAAALDLARAGVDVIAIDRELSLIELVKDEVGLAVSLDARDARALEAQGVRDADLLIAAIGDDFESQILVVVHARRLGVKRIIARATSSDHFEVLQAIGAHEVLNPEQHAAQQMVQRVLIPDVDRYLELADGFSVVEARVPPRAVGRTLEELELRRRYRLNLIAVVDLGEDETRRVFRPAPGPGERLGAGEVLVLVGSDLDLARFLEDHSEE